MAKLSSDNLIWIDLEMTGLDPDQDRIIEIATIITDSNLEILAEGPVVAIHQPDTLLDNMDEWNTSHHTSSGLVDRIKATIIQSLMLSVLLSNFSQSGCLPDAARCVATVFARTGVLWRAI